MTRSGDTKCLFCSISKGNTDAFRVFKDDSTLCFLDKRPLFPGHCLLIPTVHIETLNDLDQETLGTIFRNLQLINRAVEKAMEAEGTFVAINNRISQSVPHLHIHIVPRRKKDGLKGFFWPRNPYRDDKHMRDTGKKIKKVIKQLC